ncbi:MAG TPA: N,N-dimethylformamidase beta subunit family domain-containing protein [Gaiella sp.]|nr:N,N-dimethylformamidase beta subunit family domain-containing protein [Gaiella sp.]
MPASAAGVTPPREPVTRHLSPVGAENRLLGTPQSQWLGAPAIGRAVEVYASATDVAPGGTVAVHVSTAPVASYRILVYRLGWYRGSGARRLSCIPSCSGSEQGASEEIPSPEPTGRIVADWPTTDTVTIGRDWVSGYYLIRVVLVDGPHVGKSATTYVVVNPRRRDSKILIQVPVLTWQAYNSWGNRSLYDFPGLDPRARYVSFERPYAWDGPGGQGPLGWEIQFVRFVERNGYDVAYQSDVYTHAHPRSLLGHRLVVVAGHSEYWSKRMRDAFQAARDSGVNLAFMGANAAYWQVRLEDRRRTIVAYKSMYDPNPDPALKTAMFRELVPPRYECELIGIQHQGVGLHWPSGDYTVQAAAVRDPWMRGTRFRAGSVIRGVVSIETDTIPGNQSPSSSCGHSLTVFFHRELGGDKDGNADSTRYVAPSGAIVFASGTHQFSWGLDDFSGVRGLVRNLVDARLQRFMRNALDAMTQDMGMRRGSPGP